MRSAVLSARTISAVACALVALSLTACERVSVSSTGEQANADSFADSISRDGRYVLFNSTATNLVPGDGRDDDVFLRDRATGETSLVTAAADGANASPDGTITPSGRYVLFSSLSPTIAPGDTNDAIDLFVLDRSTGTISRESVSSSEQQANSDAEGGSISRDGRFVVFESRATNLVAGDANGVPDVFVRDRLAGTTARIPAEVTDEAAVQPDGSTFFGLTAASISLDSSTVAFSPLRYVNTGGHVIARNGADVYVRNLASGATTLVTDGAERGQAEYGAALTGNGNRVAFASRAADLVPGDTNGHEDIFIRNLDTGRTTRLPAETTGAPSVTEIAGPSLSRSGRRLAFVSTEFVNGFGLLGANIYVHDFTTGQTHRITNNPGPDPLQGQSVGARISTDGSFVTFSSQNTNLVANDTNAAFDAFVAPVPR